MYNVCQKFFLSTLGYKNDKVISHTMSSFREEGKLKIRSAVSSILNKAKRQQKKKRTFDAKLGVFVDKRRSSQLTEFELISRNLEKYPVLPPCSCKRNCLAEISEERRRSVHLQFWCLGYGHRKQWLFHSIKTVPTKRSKPSASGQKRSCTRQKRSCTRQYFLTNSHADAINICQKFFLATLGYTNDKIIVHTLSTVSSDVTTLPVSHRGKHAPAHALKPATLRAMKEHILAHHLKSASVRLLHEHFLLVNPDVKTSYESYRGMVEKEAREDGGVLDRLRRKRGKMEVVEPALTYSRQDADLMPS